MRACNAGKAGRFAGCGRRVKAPVRKYSLHTMSAKDRIPDKNRGTCNYSAEFDMRLSMQFYFVFKRKIIM